MNEPYQGNEQSQAQGARSPRAIGIAMIGAGIGVCALNLVMIALLDIYFGGMFVLGLPAVFIGAWTLFTGRTQSARSDKAPRWWTIGFYASLLVGLLAGVAVAMWIPKIPGGG